MEIKTFTQAFRLEIVAVALLVCLAVLIVPSAGTSVGNNAGIILTRAKAIALEKDTAPHYAKLSMERGPVYPGLLAYAFKFCGYEVEVAVLLTRGFFALSIVLSYIFARIIFGRLAGFASALMVLSSYGLNSTARFIDTDIVLPCFVLIFLILYALMLRSNRWLVSLAAGFALGLSIMVKESALALFGIPVMATLFLHTESRRRLFTLNAIMVVAALLTVVPWLISVYNIHNSLLPALGAVNPDFQKAVVAQRSGYDNVIGYWLNLLTVGLPSALADYYHRYWLKDLSCLAPLMSVAWLYVAVKAIQTRRLAYLLPTAAMASLLPIILMVCDRHMRFGQLTVTYYLSYIALSGALVQATYFIIGLIPNYFAKGNIFRAGLFPGAAFLALTGVLVWLQLLGSSHFHLTPTWSLWTNEQYGLRILVSSEFNVYRRFTKNQKEVAKWIQRNVPKGANVFADGSTHEALPFFMMMDRDPKLPYSYDVYFPLTEESFRRNKDKLKGHLVCVYTYSRFQDLSITDPPALKLVFQEDIVAALRNSNADYFVFSKRNNFLRYYFDSVPWAELMFNAGRTYLYKITRDDPSFGVVDLDNIGPILYVRSGDGTKMSFCLTDEYSQYRLPGDFCRTADHMFFSITQPGTFFLDSLSFEVRKADGRLINVLPKADFDFESEGHWRNSTGSSISRVKGDNVFKGAFALKCVSSAAGEIKNRIYLSNKYYKDKYGGGPNLLTFYAKSVPSKTPLINEELDNDLSCLEKQNPKAYRVALKVFEHLGLDRQTLTESSCWVQRGETP